MQIQGRELSTGTRGEDVKLLHQELLHLGLRIPNEEQDQGAFASGTRLAVRKFQETHDLPVTGIVDAGTARAINAAVAAATSTGQGEAEFVVKGTVRMRLDGREEVVAGALVRAYDKDRPLGEAQTGPEGTYAIPYGRGRFQRFAAKSVRLSVRVFDPKAPDLLLGQSAVVLVDLKEQPTQRLDVLLTPRISDYERLMAMLEPVREGVPVGKLRDDDIAFLAKETEIPAKVIAMLAAAERLGVEAELPGAVFFGLTSQNLPAELPALLEHDAEEWRRALLMAIKRRSIPKKLEIDLEQILGRLQELAKTHPAVHAKKEKEAVRRLGETIRLNSRKVEAVLKKAPRPTGLDNKTLAGLVEAGELAEPEAKELGLLTGLYGLLDDNLALAEAVKRRPAPRAPGRTLQWMQDLATFDEDDWLAILDETETEPPEGTSRKAYAVLINKKVEHLFPSNMFWSRIDPEYAKVATEDIDALRPLLERNPRVVGATRFERLDFEGIEPDRRETLQAAHGRLNGLVNTYPGLRLAEVLNDAQMSAADKHRRIGERLSLLQRFQAQNPDAEFLRLDYRPDSEDVEALSFDGLDAEARRMVLNTLKAYQRMYSVTKDAGDTRRLMTIGYPSPKAIAEDGYRRFRSKSGLNDAEAADYYQKALSLTDSASAAMTTAIDEAWGGFNQLPVSNQDASILDYLKKIEGWETLFGNLDYCHCRHCRSIFGPAAYFFDLMRFIEANVLDDFEDEHHPIHLRQRRPDLWDLPLSCENTNGKIPYLVIINEVLENHIARLLDPALYSGNRVMPFSGDLARRELEDKVYKALSESTASFSQPFSLPLARLETYLAHFALTRSGIAELLDAESADKAAAALNLSAAEYALIGVPKRQRRYLEEVYGLTFGEGGTGTTYTATDDPNEENDVQPLLKAMGLTRAELGELIQTRFVATASSVRTVEITSDKRSEESVQNDIERIQGLSRAALDRMHRFTRLWRQVPWTMRELDLILTQLEKADLATGISAATLERVAELLAVQKRFGVNAEELCTLWYYLPKTSSADGKVSLYDEVYDTVDPDSWSRPIPREYARLTHPAFRDTVPPEADPTLHRLLAALRVSDETLYALITHLYPLLRLRRPSQPPQNRAFYLEEYNLSLLYRHARLVEGLSLPVADLFLLIRLARKAALESDNSWPLGEPSVPRIENLDELILFLRFYDWWRSTGYSLEDLAFILSMRQIRSYVGPYRLVGERIQRLGVHPDPEAISQALAGKIEAEQPLVFKESVFAFAEGVTEAQSRAIIKVNTGFFVEYDLRLMSVDSTDELVDEGHSLLIVALVSNDLHIRIFDASGENVVDKAENELISGEALTALKHRLDPFPDESSLSQQDKQEIIGNVISSHTLFVPAKGSRYRLAETYSDEAAISIPDGIAVAVTDLKTQLATFNQESRPVFDDTLFTAIEGISEADSRAIVAANPEVIVPIPLEGSYCLSAGFSPDSFVVIPVETPLPQNVAKDSLLRYHPSQVIPTYVAGAFAMSVEKAAALIKIAAIDLDLPIYAEALRGRVAADPLRSLIERLAPLCVIFKDKAFDADALGFMAEQRALFELPAELIVQDDGNITLRNLAFIAIYQSFLGRAQANADRHEKLSEALLAFGATQNSFYSGGTDEDSRERIRNALAVSLGVDLGAAATAHDEIPLPGTALEALAKLQRCLDVAMRLGVGGEVLPLVTANDDESLNDGANAILAAFRAKHQDEAEWQNTIEPFEDKIRAFRRDALVDYLLHSITPRVFRTKNDLYHKPSDKGVAIGDEEPIKFSTFNRLRSVNLQNISSADKQALAQ